MAATVIVRAVTSGTEAKRILHELQVALGGGAAEERAPVVGERQAVEAALDRISATWSIHVSVRDE